MSKTIDEVLSQGFTMVDRELQKSTIFDYEAINDDDKELWLFREPEKVPETSIACMQLNFSRTRGKKLSRLYVGDDTLNLYRVPKSKTLRSDVGVSGHEMLGFSCLVPCRDAKGKMMLAPKKISNCFILKEDEVMDIYPSDTLTNRVINIFHDGKSVVLKRQYTDPSIETVETPTKRIKIDGIAWDTYEKKKSMIS